MKGVSPQRLLLLLFLPALVLVWGSAVSTIPHAAHAQAEQTAAHETATDEEEGHEAPTPTAHQEAPPLEVRDLDVSSEVLRSGSTIEVEAVVVNPWDEPVHDVRLGMAAANADEELGRSFEILEQDPSPSEPVESLGPGEELPFRGSARLEGDGWVRVGLAGSASETMLEPTGTRVRLVQAASSVTQSLALLASYIVLLGLAAVGTRAAFDTRGDVPLVNPVRPLIAAGASLLVLGPLVAWSFGYRLAGGYATSRSWALDLALLGGVALFVLGWVLIGGALRPRSSATRGALWAALLYLLVGLVWAITSHVGLGAFDFASLLYLRALLETLQAALAWPFEVVQALGLWNPSTD